MTHTLIQLAEEEFDAQYPPITNHLSEHASWSHGNECGCLFETYGEELAFIRKQNPRCVWTLVDGENGDQYLLSGFHLVNRVGYLISTVAVPAGMDIEVHVPMQSPPDCDDTA